MIKKSVVRQAISPGTSAALKVLAEQLHEAMPANWAGVDEDWDAAIEVMNDEGIPLIWVPRGNIVGAADVRFGDRRASSDPYRSPRRCSC
jgi:hypothetical protein